MAYTIWLTGLPCAGKTTLSQGLYNSLNEKGYHLARLDGDDVRQGLCKGLGFTLEDRRENLRRVAEVSKLFNKNGNIVIASFVSPTSDLRNYVKNIIGDVKLVYVKCSLEECERRDVKGMYAKAREGKIKSFTGLDAPFDEPKNPDVVVNTENNSLEKCVEGIITGLGL